MVIQQQQLLASNSSSVPLYQQQQQSHKRFEFVGQGLANPITPKKPRRVKVGKKQKPGNVSLNGLIEGTNQPNSVIVPKKRGRGPAKSKVVAANAGGLSGQSNGNANAGVFSHQWGNCNNVNQLNKETAKASTPDEQFMKQLQLQQHFYQQRLNLMGSAGVGGIESSLHSPPPSSVGHMDVALNKQALLQFSPIGSGNFHQVVPDLTSSNPSSSMILNSPLLLMTPPDAYAYNQNHEKQQEYVQQLLSGQLHADATKQLVNAIQQQQQNQQPMNMVAFIAMKHQQEQQMHNSTPGALPTSATNALHQLNLVNAAQQQRNQVNPLAYSLAALNQQQPMNNTNLAIQALIQQQMATHQQQSYSNDTNSAAAQATQAMALAIQKELQVIFQRQHIHQLLQQQLAMAAAQPNAPQLQQPMNPPINFLSPPLTHTPASDEASYATSSPNSFAGASTSSIPSSESSRSPPLTGSHRYHPYEKRHSSPSHQNQEDVDVKYDDLDAFERAIAARHGQMLSEKESLAVAVLAAGFICTDNSDFPQ